MAGSARVTGDVGAATGQLGLGHTAEEVQAMFTAAVLASTPPGSVAVGQPAGSGSSEGDRARTSQGLEEQSETKLAVAEDFRVVRMAAGLAATSALALNIRWV